LFNVFTKVEESISYIQISPCLNLNAIKMVMSNSRAVIVAGYGMGNLPTSNLDLMSILKEAVA